MSDRIKILLSIPVDFAEKFTNFINNVNAVNSDIEVPIQIEEIYEKVQNKNSDFAATPKPKPSEGKPIEDKNKT